MAFLQHQDLVAITDGAQTMSYENASTALVLKNAVDILEEGLLRVGVEGGCLDIDELTGHLV